MPMSFAKSVNLEADVPEAALQFRATARAAAELAAGLLAPLGHRARLHVAPRALHGAVTQRRRIQVGGLRGQPRELVVLRVCGAEGLHRLRLVGAAAVPNADDGAAD